MLTAILLTAFQTIFIHVLFWDGMILSKVRLWYLKVIQKTDDINKLISGVTQLHTKESFLTDSTKRRLILTNIVSRLINALFSFLKKPLFDCLICMTSIWGTIIYFAEGGNGGIQFIPFIFCVGGVLTLAYSLIGNAEDLNGEKFVNDTSEHSK